MLVNFFGDPIQPVKLGAVSHESRSNVAAVREGVNILKTDICNL